MKKVNYLLGIGILIIVLFFVFGKFTTESFATINAFTEDIIIYKTLSCGCCELYGNYFQNKGSPDTKIINLAEIDSIKEKYGVPEELKSCHTTIIGNYFVEGHVPLEAIDKLLNERPDIAGLGIAGMQGMPSGSPGMPGKKQGPFIIYSINKDGSYQEYMKI